MENTTISSLLMSLSKDIVNFFLFGLVLEVQDRIFFLARPLLTVERKLRNYLMCGKAETRTNQNKLVRTPVVLVSE